MATVLVLGNGCREHALAWKLAQSSKVKQVVIGPGNGGTDESSNSKFTRIDLNPKNLNEVISWCKENKPSLVVVGSEDCLNLGVADAVYHEAGISVFGPKKAAAQIECDKTFSKNFMVRNDIPTARFQSFTCSKDAVSFINRSDYSGFVVKASGLAAGKGVIVTESREQAVKEVQSILDDKVFGEAGNSCVVEEKLLGYEVSVHAFSDGSSYKLMPPAQDHKRAYDGDQGPNTGGMGAYCPIQLDSKVMKQIENEVIARALAGLKKEGKPFVGALYAGLMITANGPKVIEFNCRFGDPETQVMIPLLETDLYEIMQSCVTSSLHKQTINWKKGCFATCVVIASEGYPGPVKAGGVISGLDRLKESQLIAFHGGTEKKGKDIVSCRGRVLSVVALEESLKLSASRATAGCSLISLKGSFSRKDIASCRTILAFEKAEAGGLTYKAAGVDIMAGEALVDRIKSFAGGTHRKGVMESLGGFGALFDPKAAGYVDPILVSGTDGVGTKLRVALEVRHFNTVGIDLVAMCVNDILVQGAEPLFFLDYFACGSLKVDLAAEVIEGIAKGCRDSGCALIGGETAEMPGMYHDNDFDLAGFCVGAVDRGSLLPRTNDMRAGDVVIGLPSSGAHSNGFSLVRRLVSSLGISYHDPCPFDATTTLGRVLLTPTELYVKALLPVVRSKSVKGLAHITGGGLTQNIPRILPDHLAADLDATKWNVPPVFEWIQREGKVKDEDMLLTFNCGIGMTGIVDPSQADLVLKMIQANGVTAAVIGRLVTRKNKEEGVIVRNFCPKESVARQVVAKSSNKKKIAVLISGGGTNLQALIDNSTGPNSNTSSADIVLVISNIPDVQGLERAKKAGIKSAVIPHVGKKRVDFDMEIDACLRQHGVEYVFLAGYMRIISEKFVEKWEGRLVNIHSPLLPSFPGMHTHEDALAAGGKVHGCTVHFVDCGIDTGAIILQETVRVLPDDTPDILQERVKVQAEHRIFPLAMQLVTSGQVYFDKQNKKTVWKK